MEPAFHIILEKSQAFAMVDADPLNVSMHPPVNSPEHGLLAWQGWGGEGSSPAAQ